MKVQLSVAILESVLLVCWTWASKKRLAVLKAAMPVSCVNMCVLPGQKVGLQGPEGRIGFVVGRQQNVPPVFAFMATCSVFDTSIISFDTFAGFIGVGYQQELS